MNLDLDFSIVSRFFRGILKELHQKRLWPVAVVLLAALVAVPLLLSNSSSPPPVAQVPAPTPPPAPGTTLPTLNVQSTAAPSRLRGAAHDPFGAGATTASVSHTASTAATAAGSAANTAATQSSSGGAAASGAAGTSSGSGASSTPTSSGTPASNPPSITPGAKPKPAPSGLTSNQYYDVSLAMTNSSGGLNTTDPLVRLSEIPSEQQPLLVELGVLQGGNNVLFAVQPGTVVSGPGHCTPGPIDCEILSLGQDQTESVAPQGAGASQSTLFAVTGITAADASSPAAADKVRGTVSAPGRALLNKSTLSSLSLFHYEPSLGAVVDERNLTVGG